MNEALDVIVCNKAEAHQAASHAYAAAQAVISSGNKARMVVQEHDEDRSLQANRYYWGACLRDISEQARLDGQRWTVDAWHELFKRTFLGYEIVKVRVAGRKRPTIIRRLRSTKDLKVKPFSKYLEELQAFAATDLDVRFSVAKWQDYQA